MITQVFTIYDSKAECYMPPFFTQTKGSAIRLFSDTCNDREHQFYIHSEDFTLFQLGSYDDQIASFDLYETPSPIGKAIEFKKVIDIGLPPLGPELKKVMKNA